MLTTELIERILTTIPTRTVGVLSGPDAINLSPRGGIVVCEDGGGEDVDGEDNWIRGLTPDGRLFDFAKVTQRLALHDHIAADLFPYNKRRFERRPKKGQGVGASECAGIGYSPDGWWMFFHLQYPGHYRPPAFRP